MKVLAHLCHPSGGYQRAAVELQHVKVSTFFEERMPFVVSRGEQNIESTGSAILETGWFYHAE